MHIQKPTRIFITSDFDASDWNTILPYYEKLQSFNIDSEADFKTWLSYRSELDAVIEEDCAWKYIRMTIDTREEELAKAYTHFVTEIQPKIAPLDDALNRKMMESPFVQSLKTDPAFAIYFRSVGTALELYREENIQLEAEISELAQQFGSISAAQMISYNGEQMTMQKAALFLKNQDESVRKEVFELMGNRRVEDHEKLDELFNLLIQKRHQLAVNAGFRNYRDYKFKALGRFDYSQEDCFNFHASIKKHIVPLVKQFNQKQADLLGKPKLKPWDTEVDPTGKEPLKPFESGEELLVGTVELFSRLDHYFSDCIETMNAMGHLDLESKAGKAPGGYNYPLYEIGVPFIFMNAVGALRDLVTMVHEGGHAVHSFLSRDLALTGFKNVPSEVAELASMSMELLTMEHWDVFFSDANELKRAKIEQLETILKILPWIATIDEFQHWVYENPMHTIEERNQQWNSITTAYGTGLIDWDGYEIFKSRSWQRQLHLFEVPFYYIEYGIAQLGAIAIWKNSTENKSLAIQKYKEALKLGYTATIPQIYEKAGIHFDFSDEYVAQLTAFVQAELNAIQA